MLLLKYINLTFLMKAIWANAIGFDGEIGGAIVPNIKLAVGYAF